MTTNVDARHMTIGKIFSAKLLWENYKMTRKRKQPMSIYPVSFYSFRFKFVVRIHLFAEVPW